MGVFIMKKIFFLAILLVAGSVSAKVLRIQCSVYGLPVEAQFTDSKKIPYQDIVSGDFTVDTEEIFARSDFLDIIRQHDETGFQLIKRTLPCSAAGVKKSSLFGEPNGTRLQISAFQCGLPVKTSESSDTEDRYNSSSLSSSGEFTYSRIFMQKIIINGLPILDPISEGRRYTWNLLFNEWTVDIPGLVSAPLPEDLLLEQAPIHLPEGSFRFVASSCVVRVVGNIEIPKDSDIDRPKNQ